MNSDHQAKETKQKCYSVLDAITRIYPKRKDKNPSKRDNYKRLE